MRLKRRSENGATATARNDSIANTDITTVTIQNEDETDMGSEARREAVRKTEREEITTGEIETRRGPARTDTETEEIETTDIATDAIEKTTTTNTDTNAHDMPAKMTSADQDPEPTKRRPIPEKTSRPPTTKNHPAKTPLTDRSPSYETPG